MSDSTWSAKASDETKEQLAKLLEQSGIDTQKAFLEDMAKVYELHQAKSMVPILGADLDELQQLTNRINSIFVGIGERINTLVTTKEQDHQVDLTKKQGIIDTLQGRIDQIVLERDEAEANYQALLGDMKIKDETLVNLQNEMKRQVDQLTEVNHSNKDLIQQYKEKVDTLSGLLAEYQEAKKENTSLTEALQNAQRTVNSLAREKADLSRDLNRLQEQLSAAEERYTASLEQARDKAIFEQEKALLALQKEHQAQLGQLQEQYSRKVQELLERLEKGEEKA